MEKQKIAYLEKKAQVVIQLVEQRAETFWGAFVAENPEFLLYADETRDEVVHFCEMNELPYE
ncbi:GTPase Era involved in 16S rRNA processing [Brevibacillus aydinogluensis]|uniref:hypothetical protein n=1 Tax=Brevibacillus aydinogluensis TaxID=927786 RepID=UPI0028932F0E|nr:hypothetical protein [Brevibacillus aydinogluensis]MDT3417190.1 GTPase Era involved in 16S rRNA processing [Brevibacillus aydinogluensis]